MQIFRRLRVIELVIVGLVGTKFVKARSSIPSPWMNILYSFDSIYCIYTKFQRFVL